MNVSTIYGNGSFSSTDGVSQIIITSDAGKEIVRVVKQGVNPEKNVMTHPGGSVTILENES